MVKDLSPLAEQMIDPAPAQHGQKYTSSKGEKMFDVLTYGGVAGVGTFALTIPVAYWAKYGKGAQHFENAAQYLMKKGFSHRVAEELVMTSALMQGGNIGIVPVKIMENYKPELVAKLNDMLGDTSGKKSVDEDPKQTWGSLIKSRVLAWTAVFTGFRVAAGLVGTDKLIAFEENFAKKVVCKPLGQPTHIAGAETKAYRYGKIAALDVFATIAASTILYMGSRFFAKKNEHWHASEAMQATQKAPQNAPMNPGAEPPPEPPPVVAEKRFTDTIQPRQAKPAPILANGYAENRTSQKNAAADKTTRFPA